MLNGEQETKTLAQGGTVPGNESTDQVVFDGQYSEAPIDWVSDVTVENISLVVYQGQMTLNNAAVTTGYIVEDASSELNVDTPSTVDRLAVFQGGSTLTNFNFKGGYTDFLIEKSAWVNMGAQYSEQSAVSIEVDNGGTLDISGSGAGLKFTGSTAILPVGLFVQSGGDLLLKPSSGGTLITSGGPGSILTNSGTVRFYTDPNVVVTLKIPVLNAGVFSVNGGGNYETKGGTLTINASDPSTNNSDFDMTGGQLELLNATTLDLKHGYVQSGGILATDDTEKETLWDEGGLAVISGGKIVLNFDPNGGSNGPGGNLSIICTKVNFTGGEYDPTIDGQNSGSCDTLTIVGTLNLQGATMAVTIENKYGVGTWPIIKYTNGRTGTFNNPTLNGTTVFYGANQVSLV
jgi:hypothetical protein